MTFAVSVEPAPSETVTVSYETEDGTATGGAACPPRPATTGRTTSRRADARVRAGGDQRGRGGDGVRRHGGGHRRGLLSGLAEHPAHGGRRGFARGPRAGRDLECGDDDGGVDCRGRGLRGGRERGGVPADTRRGCRAGADGAGVGPSRTGRCWQRPVPASVTFAPWARKAELRVPTDDDAADESDGTVTATVAAGFSWQVADGAATASVTVLDNDAAPVAGATVADVTIWSADMTAVSTGPGASAQGRRTCSRTRRGAMGLGRGGCGTTRGRASSSSHSTMAWTMRSR